MIAHVVFPERRPRALGAFDYLIPKSLEDAISLGSGVEALFRSQKKFGVVLGLSTSTHIKSEKMKEISGILARQPLITRSQQSIVKWLANKTGSSLATTLQAFLPEKPIRTSYALKPQIKRSHNKHLDISQWLHIFETYNDLYQYCASTTIKTGHLSLFIAPDIFHIHQLSAIIPRVITYTGSLPKKEKYKTWQRVYNTSEGIIIGTRHALYLPFQALDDIFLIREESHVFLKQEQHPDYDAFSLAQKVAKEYGATLHVLSLAPRTTTYHQLKNTLTLHASKEYPKIALIDKQELARKRQSTIFPHDLLIYIKRTPGMHVLLYNRKGRFRYFNCEDCEWQAVCDACETGLIQEDEIHGLITCRVCKHQQQLPLRCPSCSSTRIRSGGEGIKFYADKIAEAFPQKNVVHSYKEHGAVSELTRADIVIGTQYMLSFLPWNRIASLSIVDIDAMLNAPDFRAHEWSLQRLRHIAALLQPQAKLFVMTRTPEHAVYRAFSSRNIQQWYAQETEIRKKLSYPPFSHLVIMKAILTSIVERDTTIDALLDAVRKEEQIQRCAIVALPISVHPEHTKKGWPAIVHLRLPLELSDPSSLLQHLGGDQWSWQENPLDLYS